MSILREELITNHLLLDYFDMWDEFDITKAEDDPKTIRYYNLIENHINNQIDATIRWLESDQAIDYFFGEAKYQKEILSALEEEWDEILSAKYPSVEALLDEVYRRGKAKGYADMREHIKFSEADKLAFGIARDYNYHLIRNIDNDIRSQIKNKINEAVITGEHPSSVARKILNVAGEKLEGSNFTPKQRATMIARTEISRVQNTGILQSYINEGYTEVKILTAGDSRVCSLCLSYAFEYEEDAEIIYDNRGEERTHNIIKLVKGGEFPPFHPLCRCTYLSVWHSKGEPPENPHIIDLTPAAHSHNIPNTIQSSDAPVINVSNSKINNALENIIDNPEDLEKILGLLDKEFRMGVPDNSLEWAVGIGKKGEYQKLYKGTKKIVKLSTLLLDAANDKGILVFVHTHVVTSSPLASYQDYVLLAKNRIKYEIVTNEFGTLIIKNKNVKKSLKHAEDIEMISSKIQIDLTKDFQSHIEYLDRTTNQKWLSDDEYNEKLQNFAKENHYKYLQRYQDELKEYLDITFINA